ncbi:MAG: CpsD/CapB family tyrosine-protein kinase [Pseudomonadota bacterium]
MEKLQAAIEKAREQRQRTVRSKSQASTTAGADLDAWAGLTEFEPRAADLNRSRIFVEGQTTEAAYFDVLRTKILQQCKDNGWRRVLVTSPTKSCGKTTICGNLAASMTRQSDRHMMVFDMDMRRPYMAKAFGYRGEYSVSDVLEGTVTFGDQAVRFGENVAISMNQAPAANPSKLILADNTPRIIDRIERDFAPDIMLFDTPPLLATDDTLALLKMVDCALIIAAAEMTTTDQLDITEKEVAEHTNVMGVVLNKCLYTEKAYGYEYKY